MPDPRSRILWNRRPSPGDPGSIDEIVIRDAGIHVEQLDDRAWSIAISTDAGHWSGLFTSTGAMRFTETDNDGLAWDDDDSHQDRTPADA